MIPYTQQLLCAKNRLNSLRREVGRNQGEMREKILKEIEVQEAIVHTIDRAKMCNEVADATIANPPKAWKGELKVG